VHRGAGAKSRHTSARYEEARDTVLRFVGADPYVVHGLVTGWTIRPWNVVIG